MQIGAFGIKDAETLKGDIGAATLLNHIRKVIRFHRLHPPELSGDHFFVCEKKGRVWLKSSISNISDLIPFFTFDKTRRALEKLKSHGLIIAENLNESSRDRTLWYSVNEDEFKV